jgi:hypothetical protein
MVGSPSTPWIHLYRLQPHLVDPSCSRDGRGTWTYGRTVAWNSIQIPSQKKWSHFSSDSIFLNVDFALLRRQRDSSPNSHLSEKAEYNNVERCFNMASQIFRVTLLLLYEFDWLWTYSDCQFSISFMLILFVSFRYIRIFEWHLTIFNKIFSNSTTNLVSKPMFLIFRTFFLKS